MVDVCFPDRPTIALDRLGSQTKIQTKTLPKNFAVLGRAGFTTAGPA